MKLCRDRLVLLLGYVSKIRIGYLEKVSAGLVFRNSEAVSN